jgi:hypothetical protein
LVESPPPSIFAVRFNIDGFVAQLDRAPDYGSGGLGFESLRDHSYTEKPAAQYVQRAFVVIIQYQTMCTG